MKQPVGNQSRPHVVALDGLRGFAALVVTFYHGITHYEPSLISRIHYAPLDKMGSMHDFFMKALLMVFDGEAAVTIFFVLSGFVLSLSLSSSAQGQTRGAVARDFIVKRILRIYPALIVCIFCFFLMAHIMSAYGMRDLSGISVYKYLRNALLLSYLVHGPSWSIQLEIMAAPIILVVFLSIMRFGYIALFFIMSFSVCFVEYPRLPYPVHSLQIYLFSFLVGIFLSSNAVRNASIIIPRHLLAVALLAFILCRHLVPYRDGASNLAHAMFAGLVVFAALRDGDSLPHRILVSRPAQILGRISYSFYLFNVPFLYLAWAIINKHVSDPPAHATALGVASAVFATAVGIPAAILSEKYIERAGIRLGKAIVSFWAVNETPGVRGGDAGDPEARPQGVGQGAGAVAAEGA